MSLAGRAALALLLFGPGIAAALDVELSVRAALWSSSRTLDDAERLTPVQLWLRASSAAVFEDFVFRSHVEGWGERQFTGVGEQYDGRLREAYVQLSAGPLELRGGRQILAWGRADGINPTDNLTPRQLTFLTRDTEDQRFGIPALRAVWFSGPTSLSLVWLAGFEPTAHPLPAAGAELQHEQPSNEPAQWAMRMDFTAGQVEGSLSYFDGYDVLPSQVVLATPGAPRGLIGHGRIRVAGGDMAMTLGRFGLRAEAAYSEAPESRPDAVFAKQAQWYAVAGADRTFDEYLNVNLQYYMRYVYEPAVRQNLSPGEAALGQAFAIAAQQYDRIDRGFAFRIRNQWLNETLEANISGLVSATRRGYLLRPVLRYRASDSWTLSLGAEILGGDDASPFGLLRDNSAAYLELRRGF